MLRKWGSTVAAVALFMSVTSASFAGTATQQHQQGALAPGGAAGVQQAQMLGTNALLILLGLGVVGGGIALVLSGNHNGSATNTTHPPS